MFSIMVLVLGVFLAIIGVMLIVAPDALSKLNDFMNKSVFSDKTVYLHRYIMAILCLVVSAVLIYCYYRYGRWLQ